MTQANFSSASPAASDVSLAGVSLPLLSDQARLRPAPSPDQAPALEAQARLLIAGPLKETYGSGLLVLGTVFQELFSRWDHVPLTMCRPLTMGLAEAMIERVQIFKDICKERVEKSQTAKGFGHTVANWFRAASARCVVETEYESLMRGLISDLKDLGLIETVKWEHCGGALAVAVLTRLGQEVLRLMNEA